jgi:glutathione-specific gamma-glutamylcyclotransferase
VIAEMDMAKHDDLIERGARAGSAVRWVFGYGSLMWRPGFPYAEAVHGRLDGLARAFCIYSVHHRGTPGRPGLVLGLAEGAGVRGLAYRVAEADWAEVYAYLLEREQPTETYVEATAPVRLDTGETVRALVFLSDPNHPQWAGRLSLERQAELIAGARGLSGRNIDYLRDLVEHLKAAGEPDPLLEALLRRVEVLEPA